MSWTVDYDEAAAIILIALRGATVGADLRDCTSASIALGKAHGSRRFLLDLTAASVTASAIELYNLPQTQYAAEHLDRWSRLAVLMPTAEKDRELAKFYETVCSNRGWRVQLFENPDEAHRWLLESTDKWKGAFPGPD